MLRSKLSSLREYITPVSNESQFIKNGTITPDEFVIAGNYLTDKFVTWSWNSNDSEVSEKNLKTRSFLPKEHQFLVTRKVVCYKRCDDLNKEEQEEGEKGDLAKKGEFEEFDEENNVWVVKTSGEETDKKVNSEDNNDNEYSLEELELEDDEDDTDSLSEDLKDSVNKRYYDLYILYSTSYKVPKLYLVGYNNEGQPLTPKEMLQDVSPEYRKKTATIEDLPVFKTKTPSISIHPCRHGDVMKLLMNRMKESKDDEVENEEQKDESISVDIYLVIFLKFMNSVVPTMQYDFTMDGG
ncbi:hypothetical protein ACO0SA_001661 [Hanseniaspora valbyensis]